MREPRRLSRESVNGFVVALRSENYRWFVELFVWQLLEKDAEAPDPTLASLASPDKLRKLNQRLSSPVGPTLDASGRFQFFAEFVEWCNHYVISM
jgi:hypothetical protein